MKRRRLAALAAVLPFLVATAPPASADPWVNVGSSVTLDGHGYGHGHGMSQHGAQGAALAGLPYRKIVKFYYPGTRWGQVKDKVRVLLTADTTSDVVVSPAAGLRLRDRGTGTVYTLPVKGQITRWRLNAVGTDTVLEKYTNRWRRHLAVGEEGVLRGEGQFASNGQVTLHFPDGSRRAYRGWLRAASPSPRSTTRDTVNIVHMDHYVKGVLPAEMPATWQPHAVRSQAIAARTYATWSREQNESRYYQICDTTACQVYGGASAEHPAANAAVDATAGEILTYQGKPAFTQFSASSGGWTAKGSVPYLPAKQDPYDDWSGNTAHDWRVTLSASRIQSAYPRLGKLLRIRVGERNGLGDWGGRVLRLRLDGTQSDVTLTGDQFRWAFGLKSNWFIVR